MNCEVDLTSTKDLKLEKWLEYVLSMGAISDKGIYFELKKLDSIYDSI